MAQAELKVSSREKTGKGIARSLRRQGLVPGVIYGKGFESVNVALSPKDLAAATSSAAGKNTLLALTGIDIGDRRVVVKDVEVHAISRALTHVDFYAVDLAKKMHAMVPVVTTGDAEGEKMGGNLQVIRRELEVFCLPTSIPETVSIDVTELNIGDVIHVEDLVLPEGVEVPHDVNFTVVTLTGRTAEAEEADAEAEAEAEAAVEE